MENLQNRHDLTDGQWLKIEPIIKGRVGNWGSANANDNDNANANANDNDNRTFVSACLWNVRTGASWLDLPPQY